MEPESGLTNSLRKQNLAKLDTLRYLSSLTGFSDGAAVAGNAGKNLIGRGPHEAALV
jgi:hypothetical protein